MHYTLVFLAEYSKILQVCCFLLFFVGSGLYSLMFLSLLLFLYYMFVFAVLSLVSFMI